MNAAIVDLGKWTEKTAQAVRSVCNKKTGPCVGFCLLFMELDKHGNKLWNFSIQMAGDPHEMNNEESKRLEKAMEIAAAHMQKAFDDSGEADISEFAVVGKLH